MKELSIEEKAKAYDEALERAMKLKENPQSVFNEYSPKEGDTICDYIFPELKESDDEMVRKEIIKLVKFYYGSSLALKHTVSKDEMVAWLEKQGEQKPQRIISAEAKEAMYNKPAWSEEDQNALEYVREAVVHYWGGETQDILLYWLKSIKQKIKGE